MLRWFGGLTAVGVAGAVAACSSYRGDPTPVAPNGRTIPIGLIYPKGGAYSKVGSDLGIGFQQYVAEQRNLFGAYTVQVRVADEGLSASDATRAAQDLISQGVVALAGIASPSALAAIAPAADTAGIPVLSAHTAPASVTTELVWRVSSIYGEAGRAAAVFAGQQQRAYVLSDPSAEAQAEVDGFTQAFTAVAGREIAGTSVGTDGFDARLQEAGTVQADVIFAAHSGDAAVNLLTAYRDAHSPGVLVGPATLTESADISRVGDLPANVYTTMFYAPDLDNDANRRFVAAFQETNSTPPTSAASAAYDAAGLLDRAVNLLTGDLTPARLNAALAKLGQIRSPRGSWTFNTQRSPLQMWYLRQLRLDGQMPSNLLVSDLVALTNN
jgi:branched-chain amino acid transport system substrate-binding protein